MEKVRNPSKHSDPKFCQMKNPRYGHFYCVVVLLFEISQYFIKFLIIRTFSVHIICTSFRL